jgi:hypothetical protein
VSFPFSSFPAGSGAGVGTPRPAGLPWLLRAGPSATLDEKYVPSTKAVTYCQDKREKFFIYLTKVCGFHESDSCLHTPDTLLASQTTGGRPISFQPPAPLCPRSLRIDRAPMPGGTRAVL